MPALIVALIYFTTLIVVTVANHVRERLSAECFLILLVLTGYVLGALTWSPMIQRDDQDSDLAQEPEPNKRNETIGDETVVDELW